MTVFVGLETVKILYNQLALEKKLTPKLLSTLGTT